MIVDDADAEKAFYRDVFGLDKLSDNILDGPEIEKMIGLPAGAALDVSIWGRSDSPLGQIEIIDYRGVDGANLYARARPKALGILHIGYELASLDALRRRLDAAGVEHRQHGLISTLYGAGEVLSLDSPAGMRIEIHERP